MTGRKLTVTQTNKNTCSFITKPEALFLPVQERGTDIALILDHKGTPGTFEELVSSKFVPLLHRIKLAINKNV